MKRLIASSVISLLLVIACMLIGAIVTGMIAPFAPSTPERTLMHWHAGITTALFVLILSLIAQRALHSNFYRVERWLLIPILILFLTSGIGSYLLLEMTLFVCGWVVIWRITTLRKKVSS